jgi:hypothetical protein
MERLGIAEQLKDKIKLVDGVPVAEIVAKGEAEIGIQDEGSTGLRRFRWRRAGGVEASRCRARSGQVYVVARTAPRRHN